MKYLFLLIFIFSSPLFGEREPMYIPYVRNLQQSYALEVHKSGLQLMSVGGCLMNDVEKIGLGLYIDKQVYVNEARRLYVKYAEHFRQRVNADRKIRPYLRNYPATINELKFSLSFSGDPNKECSPPSIENVFHANGKLCYYARNSTVIHRETYEEALKIVQQEQLYQANVPLLSSCENVEVEKNYANFTAKKLKECPPMHYYGAITHQIIDGLGYQEMINEQKESVLKSSNEQHD